MTADGSEVIIRRSLIVPLPWRVREHPERHRTARGTLVRETIVALAVTYPRIQETLQRVERLERLQAALTAYARAADAAVEVLGLEHRRDLLAADGVPLPTRLDLGDVVALAQLNPEALETWNVATAVLHVTLDLPLYAASIRASVDRVPALRVTTPWLVPSLLRYLHVRHYGALYGPFPMAEGESPRVPLEWEERAAIRAPGPQRRLADRAPSEPFTVSYQVKAWWAVRVVGQTERDVSRRWHAHMTDAEHRRKYGDDDAGARDCGCRRIVRRGVKEVGALLATID